MKGRTPQPLPDIAPRCHLATQTARVHACHIQVCAHYELVTEAFTSSCAEAQAAALQPGQHETDTHVSAGARECPQGAVGCVLSMRHYMRASSMPGERAPPFAVNIPYMTDQALDNLVIEVEDLNSEDNPTSLSVALYQTCGMQTCTHTTLERHAPLAATDSSPACTGAALAEPQPAIVAS